MRTRVGLALTVLTACQGQVGDPVGALPPGQPPPGPNTREDGGVAPDPTAPFVAAQQEARRLSQAELDQTLRDVLGDDQRPSVRWLAEDEFSPYDNDYTLQVASENLIASLEVLAADVADRAMADVARRDRLIPCRPSGPGDEACLRRFVESIGPQLLRRPLELNEADPYVALISYATEVAPDVPHDFYTAAGLVLRAFLQDPEVLYRIEVGSPTAMPGIVQLNPYELATRMSYLIWGSSPDDALYADAAAGVLDSAAGRRTAAARMFEDDRAKEQLHRFHAQWLGYRAIPHSAELVRAFNAETSALLDKVIFEDQASYTELFRSPETWVDGMLAAHYGLPAPSGAAGWVPYGAAQGRAGILSHGSVMAAFSKFTDTSPTQRGIFIRTRLMCLPILRPPPTVVADQPPGNPNETCKKARYQAHVEIESCANCHNQMDPIGFGLEQFDIAGRLRTHDEGLPECPIDGQGALPGVGPFSGPADLAQKLLDTEQIQKCVVQQYATYALGRLPAAGERNYLNELYGDFQAQQYRFGDWILSYVASEPFGLKREGN